MTRRSVESKLFDIAEDAPGSARPIYGYARHSADFVSAGSYGSAFFNIKPDPLSDISATAFDSFGARREHVTRKVGGTTEGTAEFSEKVKTMVDRHTADYLSPLKNPGTTRSYAEIQFHDRVGLKDVQSIDLIRMNPDAGFIEEAQMARMGFDYETFAIMPKDEQATYLERFARGQQDAAAKIRTSLAESGFPDIEVRTGFLNRELIEQVRNPDYMPGVRGTGNAAREFIPKYSEKIVYDTADDIAENQIGLLDSLRTSHLRGSIASSRDTMQGAQAVVEEMSPFMKKVLTEIAAKKKTVTKAGRMSESTLQGTMDAAAMAVKVMRSRL